jgi:hypothetical protein
VVAPAPKFDFSVIRHLRHRHDLTIAQLSEASGVSTPFSASPAPSA